MLGTVGALTAYLTGREAAQTIWFPGMAQAVLKDHWDWAWRTVWFFGLITVLRLIVLRPSRRDPGPLLVGAFALVVLVGIGLLLETGDRDGRLVYQHGVGIARR